MKGALLCLLPWLAGCAVSSSPCVQLPQLPRYCLQPPQAVVAQSQLVTLDGYGRHELALLQLEGDAAQLALAALSPLGQPLLTARWDGRTLSADSPFGERVAGQAAAMLALAQWLQLPQATVLQGFGRAPLWWRQQADGGRALMHGGEPLLLDEADGEGRRVRLPGLGLTLTIRNLNQDTEAP